MDRLKTSNIGDPATETRSLPDAVDENLLATDICKSNGAELIGRRSWRKQFLLTTQTKKLAWI